MQLTQLKPDFSPGKILCADMLEALRDFPQNFVHSMLSEYADGVLFGLEFNGPPDQIVLGSGVAKIAGDLWFLENEYPFAQPPREKYICIGPEINTGKMTVKNISEKPQPDELILARIDYTGGQIHCGGSRLADFLTHHTNYIDVTVCPAAAQGGALPIRQIRRCFGREMLAIHKIVDSPLDLQFAFLCLQDTLTWPTAYHYLALKGKPIAPDQRQVPPETIARALVEILGQFSSSQLSTPSKKQSGNSGEINQITVS